jgi:predicted nucleic acid-binding Zn ribbon protein
MRKSNTQPLGEVIRDYLRALDIDKKLLEVRLMESWPNVVGLQVAKKTDKLFIKNKVLFVYLNSSIVRSELLRIRESLPKALNERVGAVVINEVVIR